MFDELDKKETGKEPQENQEGEKVPQKKESGAEEVQKNKPEIPEAEVEDIFGDNEDDLDPPGSDAAQEAYYNEGKKKPEVFEKPAGDDGQEPEKEPFFKKATVGLFILGSLFLISYGSYYAYDNYIKDIFSQEKEEDGENEQDSSAENEEPEEEVVEEELNDNSQNNRAETNPEDNNTDTTTQENEEPAKDSDGDGLSDQEEMEIGTNINNIDTDGDGLFDREEVKVYGTDPLNSDTDGDGYSDGDEVDAGYNPLGDGELYDINKELNE